MVDISAIKEWITQQNAEERTKSSFLKAIGATKHLPLLTSKLLTTKLLYSLLCIVV